MVSVMCKFNIKLFAILVSFLIQCSWAITFGYVVDPEERGLYNFGWHVYTVTANEFTGNDVPFTVSTVNGTVVTGGQSFTSEIKDLNCTGKKFEKAGDFCKFKARLPDQIIPEKKEDEDLKNITVKVEYFFNDKLKFYDKSYSIDPNGRKPIYRIADVNEKNDYPALLHSNNPKNYYGVLVVENGGIESLSITNIRANKVDSNFTRIKKNPDGEEDPLYGTNIECKEKLLLPKVHDTCIVVYSYIPIPISDGIKPLRLPPSRTVIIGINNQSYSKDIMAVPSNQENILFGPVMEGTLTNGKEPDVWYEKISYFGQKALTVAIYLVDENENSFYITYESYRSDPDRHKNGGETRFFSIMRNQLYGYDSKTKKYVGKDAGKFPAGKYHIGVWFSVGGWTYYPEGTDFVISDGME